MPIQKVIQRALHGSENVTNRVIVFVVAIFLSAIVFLIMLQTIGAWGIFLSLAASAVLNTWLKKHHRNHLYINTFNNGLITFNLLLVISAIAIFILFFSVVQNALN